MPDPSPDFVAPGGAPKKVAAPLALPRIAGKYVHKVHQRNVLLTRVDRVVGADHEFESEITPDWDHPFFFEHPLDHVPAMMMVESGRQLGIAIGHLHYGVALGVVYITATFSMDFTDFANTESPHPVLIHARTSQLRYEWTGPPLGEGGPPHKVIREEMEDRAYVRGRLVHIHVAANFSQDGRDLGGMGGSCKLYPRDFYIKLRSQHLK